MTRYIVVDADGNEHTDPITDREKARKTLQRAKREGTLDYSLKTIGREFH